MKTFSIFKVLTALILLSFSASSLAIQTKQINDFCSYNGYSGFTYNPNKLSFDNAHDYCESVVRLNKVSVSIAGENVYERCMCSYTPFKSEDAGSPCPEMEVTWGGQCKGTISGANNFDVGEVSHSRVDDRYQGSASYICYDGSWTFQQGSCIQMPQKCEGGAEATWPVTYPEWAASGGGSNVVRYEPKPDCKAIMPEAISGMVTGAGFSGFPITKMDGTSPEILNENWVNRYDQENSVAKMRCFDGQWTPVDGAYECIYIPKDCPAIEYITEKGCFFNLESTKHSELFISGNPNAPFNSKGEVRAFCWDGNWEIRSESCTLSCDNAFDAYSWDTMPATSNKCNHTKKSNSFFSEERTAPNEILTLNNENSKTDGLRRLKCSDGKWLNESEICAPKDCTSGIVAGAWSVSGNSCQHDSYDKVISAGSRVQLPNILDGKIGAKSYYCNYGVIVEESSNHTCSNIGDKLCYVDQGTFNDPYFLVPAWNERGITAKCRFIEDKGYTHCVTDQIEKSGSFCQSPMGDFGTEYSELTSNSCQLRVAQQSPSNPKVIEHTLSMIGKELKTYQCNGVSWDLKSTTCVAGYTQSMAFTTNPKPADPEIDESLSCPAQVDYVVSWKSSDGDIYNFKFDLEASKNMDTIAVFDEIPAALGQNKSCNTSYVSVGEAQCVGENWEFRLSQHCRGNVLEPDAWTVQVGCQTSPEGDPNLELEWANTGTCNRNLESGRIEDKNRKELAVIYPLIDDQPFNNWYLTECKSADCTWDYEVLEYSSDCRICAKNGHINDESGACFSESSYNDRIYVGLKPSDEVYEQFCDARFKLTFTDGVRTETLNIRGISYAEKPCLYGNCDSGLTENPQCGYENGRTSLGLTDSSTDLCYIGDVEMFDGFSNKNEYRWKCVNGENAVNCSSFKAATCGEKDGKNVNNLTNASAGLCGAGTATSFNYDMNEATYSWFCTNGSSMSEECSAVKTSACGAANLGVFSTPPRLDDLCETGKATAISEIGSMYSWDCKSGSIPVNCSAYKEPSCGSALGGTFSDLTSTNSTLCGIGSVDGFALTGSQYNWSCENGGETVRCSANASPTCGAANGLEHSTRPSTNLCGVGVSSVVSDDATNYNWSCSNGSEIINCSSYKTAVCGLDNGSNPSILENSSSGLCETGEVLNFDDSGDSFLWSCKNNNSTVNCSAFKDASCGLKNGGTYGDLDMTSTDLCSLGDVINFDNTSQAQYRWSCESGSSVKTCSAFKDSGCGTANNKTFGTLSQYDSSLCSVGVVNNFNITNENYQWDCVNGSATLNCRANRTPACGDDNGRAFDNLTSTSSNLCARGTPVGFTNANSELYEWSCKNGTESVDCKAYKENNCGVRANGSYDSLTKFSTGLCENGNVGSFTKNETTYNWTCENGPSIKNCLAYENAQCGSSIGSCSKGQLKNFTSALTDKTAKWICENNGGFESAECSAPKAPSENNGECGSSLNSCNKGSFADEADTSTTFYWSCGENIPATHYKESSRRVMCNLSKGSCGAANGMVKTNLSSTSPELCSNGAVVGFGLSNTKYTWSCNVDGVNSPCEAYQETSCGSRNENTYAGTLTETSTGLCSVGSVVQFVQTGTKYNWNCVGADNKSVSSCVAYQKPSCGSANGNNYESLQSNEITLCSVGTIVGFNTSSTKYTWGCKNLNGETVNCSANRIIEAGCGVKNGTVTQPVDYSTDGLCVSGSPANILSDSTRYMWECVTATETKNCFSYAEPDCGINNGGTFGTLLPNDFDNCSVGNIVDFVNSVSEYTWGCKNGSSTVSCSAAKEGVCGSSNGQTLSSQPSSGLCSIGDATAVSLVGDVFNWNCMSGSSSTACSAYKEASCGAKSGTNTNTLQSTDPNLCTYGTVSGFNVTQQGFDWSCVNGTSTDTCNAFKTSVCGSSNTGTFETLTETNSNLCSVGSVQNFISGNDSYSWDCKSGESLNSCMAYKTASCGTANGVHHANLTSSSTNLCERGLQSGFVAGGDKYTWKCNLGSSTVSCSGMKVAGCGDAYGLNHSSLSSSSANLCKSGNAVNFGISGTTYSWNCDNSGNTVSCFAYQDPTCNNNNFAGCGTGSLNGILGNTNDDFLTWTCKNDYGKLSSVCSKEKNPPIDQGSCGTTLNSCLSGTFTDLPDNSGSYDWQCGSDLDGTMENKQSFKEICSVAAAACGSANGSTHPSLTSSSTNLCGTGSTVSGFVKNGTTYDWSCNRNGGTVSCKAYQQATCNNQSFGGCSVGSFVGYTSALSSSTSTWNCKNDRGDLSVQCSKPKNPPTNNGACGTSRNACVSGTLTDTPDTSTMYKWSCGADILGTHTVSPSYIAHCEEPIGSCGSVNDKTYPADTSDSLKCASGSTLSNKVISGTDVTWRCNRSGGYVNCKHYIAPSCGSAAGSTSATAPSTNLCAYGTASTVTASGNNYNWSCTNSQGQSTSCSSYRNALCGNDFYACAIGNPVSQNYTNNTTAEWNCVNGTNTSPRCTKPKNPATVNGSCGASNGKTLDTTPTTGLCATGTATTVSAGTTSYTWKCNGSATTPTIAKGTDVNCSATRVATPSCGSEIGSCVNSTRVAYTSALSSATSTWTCRNDAGTEISCSAPKNPPTNNGACGTSRNACVSGTLTDTPDTSTMYKWSCGANISATHTTLPSYIANCELPIGSCGSVNNKTYPADTSDSQKCASGSTLSNKVVSGTDVTWRCNRSGGYVNCKHYIAPSCGSAAGSTSATAPSTNLCAYGTASTVTASGNNYNWSCTNSQGQSTSCSSFRSSLCGNDFYTCVIGTPENQNYTDNTTARWDCVNGTSSTLQCAKPKNPATVNGSCGTSSGKTLDTAPTTGLCATGTATTVTTGTTSYTWKCNGSATTSTIAKGADVNCSATRVNAPSCGSGIGACVNSTRVAYTSALSSTTSVWTCRNDAGTEISCSAPKNPPTNNGTCGASRNACVSGTLTDTADTSTMYKWSCGANISGTHTTSPSYIANCELPIGSCGSVNNKTYPADTSDSQKCASGSSLSNKSISGTTVSWRCNRSGGYVSCKHYIAPSCGSASGGTSATAPTSNLCAYGTASTVTASGNNYNWSCTNSNGQSTSCSSFRNALCGNDFYTCTIGNPVNQNYTNNTTAEWNCVNGANTSPRCTKPKNPATVNGSCGASNGKTLDAAPTTGLCAKGTATTVTTGTTSYTWKCNGSATTSTIAKGADVNCSATRVNAPSCGSGIGSCVNSTRVAYTSALTSTTSVWTCRNSAGTEVSCSAPKNPPTNNGVCGTDNNQCISGTLTDINDSSSNLLWNCGENIAYTHTTIGSSVANCSIPKVTCGSTNGGSYSSLSTGSCGNGGSVSGFKLSGTTYSWNCVKGSQTIACKAYRLPVCNNSSYGGCSVGTFNGYTSACSSTTSNWSCKNDKGETDSCSRAKASADQGSCGTSLNSCASGTFRDVTDTSGEYKWTCGTNISCTNTQAGSTMVSCSLSKPACGTANGNTYSSDSANCASGSSLSNKSISGTTVSWRCNRSGQYVNCSHKLTATCGSANGTTRSTAPSGSILCGRGSASSVSTSSTVYKWSCSNGSTSSVTCSATREAACDNDNYWSCNVGASGYNNVADKSCSSTQAGWNCKNGSSTSVRCVRNLLSASSNGSCGSANNGTYGSAPSSGLCSSGTATTPYKSGSKWYWSCNGSAANCGTSPRRAGTNASCSANAGSPPACGTGFNTCSVGVTSGYTSSTSSTTATWNCTSIGQTKSCSKPKTPSYGVCGAGVYQCSSGGVSNQGQSGRRYTWDCVGINSNTTYRASSASCFSNGGIEP